MLFESVRTETIHVELLNEGTPVWRPVSALQVGPRTFVVLRTRSYDPKDEEWEFPPGSIVVCRKEVRDGKDVLVAISHADI